MLMAYEATRDFQLAETTVTTPITETTTYVLCRQEGRRHPDPARRARHGRGHPRAHPRGQGGSRRALPRPETLQPVEYYCKLPEDIGERDILIVDPMLATGGSAAAAVQFLRATRRALDQPARAHRRSRGHRRGRQELRRCSHLHVLHRQPPQRSRLHRSRPRRCRRPVLRHQVAGEARSRCPSFLGRVLHEHRRAGGGSLDVPAPPDRCDTRQGPAYPGDRLQRHAGRVAPLRGGRLSARAAQDRFRQPSRALPWHPCRAERGHPGGQTRHHHRRARRSTARISRACCARRSSSTPVSSTSHTATRIPTRSPRRSSERPGHLRRMCRR
jgi:hypothetical protein